MKKNELSKEILSDGQPLRAIHNYLIDSYKQIKGHEFDTGEKFTDVLDFIDFIEKSVCYVMKNSITAWKEDSPEEYAKFNK